MSHDKQGRTKVNKAFQRKKERKKNKSLQGYENQHNKSSNSLIPNFQNSIYTVMLGNKRLLAQWEREINFLFGTNEKTNKDLETLVLIIEDQDLTQQRRYKIESAIPNIKLRLE